MRKFLRLVIISLLFSSCYHENKPEVVVPERLLSEEEMVLIMTDLQLAEGVITYNRLQKLSRNSKFKDSVYNLVLTNYKISLDELISNFDYYNSDPQKMELLYEKVLSNLSKLQSEVELAAKKDTIPDIEEK